MGERMGDLLCQITDGYGQVDRKCCIVVPLMVL